MASSTTARNDGGFMTRAALGVALAGVLLAQSARCGNVVVTIPSPSPAVSPSPTPTAPPSASPTPQPSPQPSPSAAPLDCSSLGCPGGGTCMLTTSAGWQC